MSAGRGNAGKAPAGIHRERGGSRCSEGNRCLDPGSQGESKGSAGIAACPSKPPPSSGSRAPWIQGCPCGVPVPPGCSSGVGAGNFVRSQTPKAERDRLSPEPPEIPGVWLGTLGVQVRAGGLELLLGSRRGRWQLQSPRGGWRVQLGGLELQLGALGFV